MRTVFALGVGRSGTTLLGRLLAATSTPARFVNELCPGLPDRIPSPLHMVRPGDVETAQRVRDALAEIAAGHAPFDPVQTERLERDDTDAEVLLVKDVHSLFAYPEIVEELDDWRTIVITRDPLRSLDSYLYGHRPALRRYLIEEWSYLSRHLDAADPASRLARAAASVVPSVAAYLRRPRWRTREAFRHAAVTELIVHFQKLWAAEHDRVMHVDFEGLCRDPEHVAGELFDFAGLKADARTWDEIRRTTRGSSDAYYATDKDSQKIVDQPFRHLRPGQVRRLRRFLGSQP